MSQSIREILKNNYVESVFHTHVSLIKPLGKFQFNRQVLEKFWMEYCNFLTEEKDPVIGIAEKCQQYLPVLVDIDMKIKDDEDFIEDSLYEEKDVKIIIGIYQSILRQIVSDCNDTDLICVLLEKKMYQQTKNDIVYLKHGFHLHFPYLFLNKTDQEVQLIPRVLNILKETKIFENIPLENREGLIDKSCCSVPWLLYGSKKSENAQAYKITTVYNGNLEEITLEKAFKYYELFDHKEQLIPIKGKVDYYIPRILSVVPYGRKVKELKHGIISPLKEVIKKRTKISSSGNNKLSTQESLDIAKVLLPMLSEFRVTDRNEWLSIGWILYNISDGSSEGLDLWTEFSSRCEEVYDESGCIHSWERMTKKDLGMGTLRHYAQLDSPELYKKFKDERQSKHIKNSLDGSHNDIAKALFEEYCDDFICSSVSNKSWYQFSNHIWKPIEDGVYLREKISSGKIIGKYVDAIKNLYTELQNNEDKGKESMINARIKQLQKMISNLKNSNFKNSVMKECCAEGTLVTLSSGITVNIEDMENSFNNILCWSSDRCGIVSSKQINHLFKGEKECLEITVQDGSSITVTHDHKILRGSFWVESKVLKAGDHLYTSLKGPIYKYNKNDYMSICLDKYIFNTSTENEYRKFLAFMRLAGYLYFSYITGKNKIYFKLLIDANNFIEDIKTVLNIKQAVQFADKDFTVEIPDDLFRLLNIFYRDCRNGNLPSFLFTSDCLESIRNEFLSGLWSKFASDPEMIGENIYIGKVQQYQSYLLFSIQKLLNMSNISFSLTLENNIKYLSINIDNIKLFNDIIGIRYSINKSTKYNLLASYKNFEKIVHQQYHDISKIMNNGYSFDQAFNQVSEKETILLPKLMSGKEIYNFPSFRQYLTNRRAVYIFDKNYKGTEIVPNFKQKIICIRNVGIKKVYDINVEEHHSFLANGILVHNCMEVFYESKFKNKLNTNPYLIAFKNGVYDLQTNIFRAGRPEDFLSKTMPIDYVEYSETDDKVQKVYTFLEQVFPDKSVRKYFLDVSSDTFVGGNLEKIIQFWIGDGDNGKSITQQFFDLMLGDLSVKLNTTVVTGKKTSAGSSNADLARTGEGVRRVVLEEPDGDEELNIGILKNLSGNDKFFARDLFEKGKDVKEINPMFKIVFICNKLPRIKHADRAIWNRARVIPFESTFCRPEDKENPCPDTYEEQLRHKKFPMDKQFGSKIPDLVQALAWILLQHRQKIHVRFEPEKVRSATEMYRKQNDIYRQFIEESICDDKKKYLSLIELYNFFKDWFKNGLPGRTLPIKDEIEEYFTKLWGQPESGKRWKGYRQRTLQDDIMDGEVVILTEDDLDKGDNAANPL